MTDESEERANEMRHSSRRRPRVRLAAVLALALATAFGAWLLVRGEESEQEVAPPPPAAEATSAEALRALARNLDAPLYWAGPQAGVQYELSRTGQGRMYVRYLPQGAEIGDPEPKYLTVGTYPLADAFAATRSAGEEPGGVSKPLAGGGLAVYNTARPSSVYVAFPGSNRQVEVFHPVGKRALQLVTSGRIVPVVAPPAPRAVTRAELRQAQADVGHPIYWLGPRPNVTYELTVLEDGRTYVRYLPRGVEVGDERPRYATVGTYPFENALQALMSAAKGPGAVTFEPRAGGLAFYNRETPKSVYFALPDWDYEIEVFAPSAERARSFVRTGKVIPVG